MASRRLCVPVRQIQSRLRRYGYTMERKVGSHEQWRCPKTNKTITVSVHGTDIRGEQVKNIYDQAGWELKVHDDKLRKRKSPAPPLPQAQEHSRVQRIALRILGGELANHVARAEKVGLSMAYSIAHGTHAELDKQTAGRLKKQWAGRIATKASGRAAITPSVATKVVNQILAGVSVTEAGEGQGINQKSAFRIATGRHRALTSEQCEQLEKRPNQTHRATATQLRSVTVLRLEVERLKMLLQKEREMNASLRDKLVAARRQLPIKPTASRVATSCLHGEVILAVEAVVDAEAARRGIARRAARPAVAHAWVGQSCPRCRHTFTNARQLLALMWPG